VNADYDRDRKLKKVEDDSSQCSVYILAHDFCDVREFLHIARCAASSWRAGLWHLQCGWRFVVGIDFFLDSSIKFHSAIFEF
jgi:hypothetical protein